MDNISPQPIRCGEVTIALVVRRARPHEHTGLRPQCLTAVGLTIYLFLHLAVLSLCWAGRIAGTPSLAIAKHPLFLLLDVVLLFGVVTICSTASASPWSAWASAMRDQDDVLFAGWVGPGAVRRRRGAHLLRVGRV
jgi:hypothetical protein